MSRNEIARGGSPSSPLRSKSHRMDTVDQCENSDDRNPGGQLEHCGCDTALWMMMPHRLLMAMFCIHKSASIAQMGIPSGTSSSPGSPGVRGIQWVRARFQKQGSLEVLQYLVWGLGLLDQCSDYEIRSSAVPLVLGVWAPCEPAPVLVPVVRFVIAASPARISLLRITEVAEWRPQEKKRFRCPRGCCTCTLQQGLRHRL